MLSKADHQRVHDAILAAEQATSGEIFCVVAHESSPYRETPFAWAAAVALIAPPLVLSFTGAGLLERLLGGAEQGWSTASAGGAINLTQVLLSYAVVQAGLFVAAFLIVALPAARRLATPSRVKQSRVHARALEQFAHRAHATEAQTGVLIYASLAERRVQIIADEAIHKLAGAAAWDKAVAAALGPIGRGDTAGGLIEAIRICGQVLAEHRPALGERTSPPGGDVWEV